MWKTIKKYIKKLVLTPSEYRFVMEHEDLMDDMDYLDKTNPKWYKLGCVAGAESSLGRGSPRKVVVEIYGEEIVAIAEKNLKNKNK